MYYYVEPNIPIPLTSNTLQPKTTSYVLSPSLSDYTATPTPMTNRGKCFDLNTLIHLIIGSCLTLNLNYSGCCVSSLSQTCRNNGCYCDQSCYDLRRCCSDIAEIGCLPVNSLELNAHLCMCMLYLSINCYFCIIVVIVSLVTIF